MHLFLISAYEGISAGQLRSTARTCEVTQDESPLQARKGILLKSERGLSCLCWLHL